MNRQILLIILILAFALRICFFLVGLQDQNRFLYADASRYLNVAKGMIQHGVIKPDGKRVDMFSMPFFPLFCAVILRLTSGIPLIILFQILVTLFVCFLIFRLGTMLFNQIVGLIAAFLYSVDILSIIYANLLLTETLFTLFLISSVYLFILFLERSQTRYLVFSSLFLGIAALTRCIAMYFIIILIFILFVKYFKKFILFLKYTAISFFIFFLFTGLWSYKNYVHTGYFTLSLKPAATLYACMLPGIDTIQDKAGDYSEINAMYIKKMDRISDEYKVQKLWAKEIRKETIKKIIAEPHFFILSYLKGITRMLISIPRAEFTHLTGLPHAGRIGFLLDYRSSEYMKKIFRKMHPAVVLFSIYGLFFNFIILLFSFIAYIAFFDIPAGRRISVLFLILSVVYFIVTSTGGNAAVRFKVPMMPLLCVFAGYGMLSSYKKLLLKNSHSILERP